MQVKMTVAEATAGAALVFQAVQLAQQAAPAIRTATGDGGSDGSGFFSFSSTKAVITTVQKPLPGPEREAMPIDEHRDEIVRTIRERRVTCIQGETGCGKSSRVPQYVYHLCRQPPKRPGDPERVIVCTQPRRLAALTLAQRVAKEMGEQSIGSLVGFRISGESVFDFRRTKILFVTTGYLLQVLVNDPGQIHRYSHIILDEAHERSVDADLLSLVLKLQPPGKDESISTKSVGFEPIAHPVSEPAEEEPVRASRLTGIAPKVLHPRIREDWSQAQEPCTRLLASLDARLDQLSHQVEACLTEILSLKEGRSFSKRLLSPVPGGSGSRDSFSEEGRRSNFGSQGRTTLMEVRPSSRPSTTSRISGRSLRNDMVTFRDEGRASVVEYTAAKAEDKPRRHFRPVRSVDLKIAWQIHAKELCMDIPEDETRPILRLLYRSRCEVLWELLDDPDSGRGAWWASQFLKAVVILNLMVANLMTVEGPMDRFTGQVLGCFCDIVFCVEFLCRLFSAPSKKLYLLDPFNWTDFVSATSLPLRASLGFDLPGPDLGQAEVVLLVFLPVVCSLKLLRYFESFRLLIDACKNSLPALPVLLYTMAVITLLSASAIYLVESRDNIPTMPHAFYLSLVTMATVGYGDFAPKSSPGFVVVSALTCVSVLFLGLPVGIIGHEFKACWESRSKVLLMTRVRKCLAKWGYTSKDLQVLVEFVDQDGDGTLNLPEFMELISQLRVGVSVETAVQLFTLFDDDQNGSLDYYEFLRHLFPHEYVKDQQLRAATVRESSERVSRAIQHLDTFRNSTVEEEATDIS
ncbi:unnamed protein product [Effrenium voratum]|nr:unnamed protein product [Effrenium voratum]